MRWYSGFVKVPKGTGDYGSDRKCVFNQNATDSIALGLATSYAMEYNSPVEIFKGKTLGKLWNTVHVGYSR